MNTQISCNKHGMAKLASTLFVLLACLLNPYIANAQNDTVIVPSNYEYSAWVLYDSVCMNMDSGKIELAESESRRILEGIEEGEFVECTDEEAVKHLQYKSHVVLANIAMAEKRIKDLSNEVLFFENVDTTYELSVWFLKPEMDDTQDDTISVLRNYDNSAWVLYDSVCTHMNRGNIDRAKIELWTILEGLDEGEFVECDDELAVKILKYKSHVVWTNIAIAENWMDELNEEVLFFKNADCFGLSVCFVNPGSNEEEFEEEEQIYSAWVLYDSVVGHINQGEVALAKSKLRTILDDLDEGKFVECSDDHTVRLLQYKSHVVLANIAFAEKRTWDLDREIEFFLNTDTTQIEWKRAGFAATHFKHKYYQLLNGKYGKVIGDWVSPNSERGIPMVWIKVYLSNNTLIAELKDCVMKNELSSKYPHFTDKIALDNVQNIMEVNFGESKLMPGMQYLPSALISMVNEMSNTFSEAIAWKSTYQYGTPYTGQAVAAQLGLDATVLLVSALISQLSVTKETMTSESFVMRPISSEVYMANIKLRNLTAYSDGRSKDEFDWAEIPIIHLYPFEESAFSGGNQRLTLDYFMQLIDDELKWDGSEESIEESNSVAKDIASNYNHICFVENTRFDHEFYFLGKDINFHVNSDPHATFFTGLAETDNLWGFKENPINPLYNRSEINKNIVPLRGVFQTVLSPYECVTFTGDWCDRDECGNGLLSYVNTYSPEFSFTYEGTIRKGYPHGLGIWQGDGFRYVGWFYRGKKFGYGTMFYEDGREERGFVTEDGSMIPESRVTMEMEEDFNDKVEDIASERYTGISDKYYWLNE